MCKGNDDPENSPRLITEHEYFELLRARLAPPPLLSLSVISVLYRIDRPFSYWTIRFILTNQSTVPFGKNSTETFTGKIVATFTFQGPDLLRDTEDRAIMLGGEVRQIQSVGIDRTIFKDLKVTLQFKKVESRDKFSRYDVSATASLPMEGYEATTRIRSFIDPLSIKANPSPGDPVPTPTPPPGEGYRECRCCTEKSSAGDIEVCESRWCQKINSSGDVDCDPEWTREPGGCSQCAEKCSK